MIAFGGEENGTNLGPDCHVCRHAAFSGVAIFKTNTWCSFVLGVQLLDAGHVLGSIHDSARPFNGNGRANLHLNGNSGAISDIRCARLLEREPNRVARG